MMNGTLHLSEGDDLYGSHTPQLVESSLTQGGKPSPTPSHAESVLVTPDEVLTLGALALAGLWPGTWYGIAIIIIHQVERLAQRGKADAPFRRCAMSLVEMLLKSPDDPIVAVETWQYLAGARARLPEELSQVLGLACALLQSRTMEAADIRTRRKRRRTYSVDTVSAISVRPPCFTPPCATALVMMVSDMGCEDEEDEKETEESEAEDAVEEEKVDNSDVVRVQGSPELSFPPLPQALVPPLPNHLPPLLHMPGFTGLPQNHMTWGNVGRVPVSIPPSIDPLATVTVTSPPSPRLLLSDFGSNQMGFFHPRGMVFPAHVSPVQEADGDVVTSPRALATCENSS